MRWLTRAIFPITTISDSGWSNSFLIKEVFILLKNENLNQSVEWNILPNLSTTINCLIVIPGRYFQWCMSSNIRSDTEMCESICLFPSAYLNMTHYYYPSGSRCIWSYLALRAPAVRLRCQTLSTNKQYVQQNKRTQRENVPHHNESWAFMMITSSDMCRPPDWHQATPRPSLP